MALLWAVGIVWLAVDFVGADNEGDQPVDQRDAAALAHAFGD
ncbi:MAG: hypothetical protein R3E11_11885 [Sphingobium sp.]